MKTVVIIPAYNEEKVIGKVIEEVRAVCPHVFVVDDGSDDGTAAAARTAGAKVFMHSLNRGQGAALTTGIEAALAEGAEIIVTFDADGQMSSADIPALTAPIKAGLYDVVLGSRFLRHAPSAACRVPLLRRLTLKLALWFTRLTTGLRLTDTHNGLRAFRASHAACLKPECDRMAHASEILEKIAAARLRYAEIPITIRYTEYSLKKGQKLSGAWRILRDLLIAPWTRE